jgi:hypothetical protein
MQQLTILFSSLLPISQCYFEWSTALHKRDSGPAGRLVYIYLYSGCSRPPALGLLAMSPVGGLHVEQIRSRRRDKRWTYRRCGFDGDPSVWSQEQLPSQHGTTEGLIVGVGFRFGARRKPFA